MSFIQDTEIEDFDRQGWIQPGSADHTWIRKNLIERYYPRLVSEDREVLLEGVVRTVNWIHLKYGFGRRKSSELLWNQLIQNDLQDLRAVMASLLPYINNDTTDEKKRNLTHLRDLYLAKDDRGDYVYTNSQYDRCVRQLQEGQLVVKHRPYLVDYFCNNNLLLFSTIEATANKLFVNWIDVLPLRMDQFRSSELYQDTLSKFQRTYSVENRFQLLYQYLDPTPGLSYSDIYNVLVNHFYHDIKNQKWIIYDLFDNGTSTTYIKVIEKNMPLGSVWKGLSWSQLSEGERSLWNAQWGRMLRSTDDGLRLIVSKLYIFFVSHHVNSRRLINQGLLRLTDTSGTLEEEDAKVTPETTRNAQLGMKDVPGEEIYLFFLNELGIFKKSWFYYITQVRPMNPSSAQVGGEQIIYLTPKNFYNYAKSLANIQFDGEYTALPRHWQSLEKEYLESVIIRLTNYPVRKGYARKSHQLNDWTVPNWFNLNRYFRRLYPGIAEESLLKASETLHLLIRERLIESIFESMIFRGILSSFDPMPDITDNERVSKDIGTREEYPLRQYKRSLIRRYILNDGNRPLYEKNSYHFLANVPYGDLEPLTSPSFPPPTYSLPYLDYISSSPSQSWVFTYAVNWVCQWSFYHHYINNRVLYVTGATGLGKSTQVPKLLLYGQKIIDYHTDGKIICTLPRVPPTVGTAETISMEMGIPIRRYDPAYQLTFSTGNFYIQYRHQMENHMVRCSNYLRTVTDGTLYAELVRYPFLTKVVPEKSAIAADGTKVDWMIKCRSENVYDIVIVDEAHEHNPNMDMILTMMRDVCYVNNSLRLAIISATMDDDEPIYRRYYRDVNDNRAYPLNSFIQVCPLDRVNVDRRVDISPPGKTTQYEVKDIYLSKREADKINAQNYVEYGIDKTVSIINSTNDYNLLLFMAGKKDIIKAVQEINRRTPDWVLALPYYSQLSALDKKSITGIHETLPKYTRGKRDVLLDESEVVDRVPAGTYRRAVIVATNIAEASLSLSGLKYVVETGYANSLVYDPLEDSVRVVKQMISRVSSTQRRGRVGRMMEGEVYYMYDEDRIRYNKTLYQISITDFLEKLTSLIQKEPGDVPLITEVSDINHVAFLDNLQEKLDEGVISSGSSLVYELLSNPRPYLEIIQDRYTFFQSLNNPRQYYTYYGRSDRLNLERTNRVCGPPETQSVPEDRDKMSFDLYCRRNHNDYDYQALRSFCTRKHTGFSDSQLLDSQLDFFIIHPDENIIQRDLYTGRVKGIRDCRFEKGSYCEYTIQRNGRQVKEVLDPSFRFDGFFFYKQYLSLEKAMVRTSVIDVSLSASNLTYQYTDQNQLLRQLTNEFFQRIVRQMEEGECGFWDPGHVHCLSSTYQRLQKIAQLVDLPIIGADPTAISWYTLGLARGIENDILAVMTLIEVFPDYKAWIYRTEGISDVTRFFRVNSDSRGDIHFLWKFWKRVVERFRHIFDLLVISSTTEDDFRRYRNQYYAGDTTLDPVQRVVMDKMFYRGELGTEHEYYHYISLSSFNIEAFLRGTDALLTFNEFIASDDPAQMKIDPVRFAEFLESYCTTVYQQNKNMWLYQYEVEHQMALEEVLEVRENLVEWIKSQFSFRPLFEHRDEWDLFLDSYVRAHSTQVLFNLGDRYRSLDRLAIYRPAVWSERLRIPLTVLPKGDPFLIYHDVTIAGKDSIPVYLTPIQLDWVFRANPYYYFLLIFDPKSIVGEAYRLHPTEESQAILDRYRHFFSTDYVVEFLDDLKDPILSANVRELIYQLS